MNLCKDRQVIRHLGVGGYLLTRAIVVCGNGESFWVKPTGESKQ